MAAKGSILKGEVTKKILEAFPGSFLYNDGKEIRINGTEAGVELQIKVTLTCAKEMVAGGDGGSIAADEGINFDAAPAINETVPDEPSDDEKARLAALLEKLGI